MEEDLETLLALERANIIANYTQARPAGSPRGPREDAELSLCRLTDHHGFLQEKELPGPSPHEAKQRRQETRRADKWVKMLRNWDRYRHSEKMRRRVYKGVPPQVRGQLWALLLDIETVKATNQGVYEKMKEQAQLFSKDIRQIDLDVNRTFRNHVMFWDRYGIRQRALFHVLSAYSIYNTEVGYCQGMSQIVGLLLMFLSEEDAFWALAQLMTTERHAMHGFPKLLRFQAHHDLILAKGLPRLKEHLDEEQMGTGIYTAKWFLQCFIDRTPFSLTLKLWDTYILDGERVLTAMAYTVLKVHSKRLLKLPLEGLREFLQDTLAQPWALDDEGVLRHLRASMAQLRKMQCDLPPPAGPEEFPTMPLGLEQGSPAPRPLLPSSSVETLPGVDGPASPGPATQREQLGHLPSQAILQAEEPLLREGTSTEPAAAHLRPGAPGAQVLTQLPPAQDPWLAQLPPQRCNSLPNLQGHQDSAGRWPLDVGLKAQYWVPFPSAPTWATPGATPQTRPRNTPGTPRTASTQPRKEAAVGPRTLFPPCGHCSSCPSLGSDRHSRDRIRAALNQQPQGPAPARDPLTSTSMGTLDAPWPLEQSVVLSVGALRLWPASTMPCLVTLAFLEDGNPPRRHKSLTQGDLSRPGPRP